MERFYPLHARVCARCLLVQLPEIASPEQIFEDYAYFSSYSKTWLEHARDYVEQLIPRLSLGAESRVIEIASNDGYLLRYFKEHSIPVLGIEPAANVARAAQESGIPTLIRFFGTALARELAQQSMCADLLVGNNVLAHVPDLNDFVAGLKIALKRGGIITMEFPHLARLIAECQFDTIYHEHFSYFSFATVNKIFQYHGLQLFDVEELPTHGGSLRIFAQHSEEPPRAVSTRVDALLERERAEGLHDLSTYVRFGEAIREVKRALLDFLIRAKRENKRICGYGAPAKGNTLLNYCGVRGDFLDFTVDRSPHKQGLFLPGTHIPISSPERIQTEKPDYVLILPWNLRGEIMEQLVFIREWGGRFVVPIPRLELVA